jgi:5-formyltetrahydrofolate cyclo-ligase
MLGKQNMRRMADAARVGTLPVDLSEVLAELLAGPGQVASYVGFGAEPFVPPRPGWLLPVLREDDDLDWARYDGQLAPGRRGLLEPTGPRLGVAAVADCAVVLVPALRVDRSGNRLGKGGGSYDRALARATGLTVALLHDDELVDAVPHEPHDVPVRAVASPGNGLVVLAS